MRSCFSSKARARPASWSIALSSSRGGPGCGSWRAVQLPSGLDRDMGPTLPRYEFAPCGLFRLGLGKFSPPSLTVSSLAALALRAWYAFSSGAIVPSMLLSIYLGCGVLKCRDGGTVAVQLTRRVRHSANCLLLGWMDGRKQIMSPAIHSFAAFSVPTSFYVAQCTCGSCRRGRTYGTPSMTSPPSSPPKGLLTDRARMLTVAGTPIVTPRLQGTARLSEYCR